MHRKRQSSSGSGNGLVMLYEAAMLIEQQSIRLPRATFPPVDVNRPLSVSHRVPLSAGGHNKHQHHHHQQQQHHHHQLPPTRVRVELAGGRNGGYQLVATQPALAATQAKQQSLQQQQQQQQRLSPAPSRSSHNELEKNRRAHLRQCLDTLRDQLPLNQGEASRLTMLSVLTKSHGYLKELQSMDSQQKGRMLSEQRRQRELLHRREQLRRSLRALKKRLSGTAGGTAGGTSGGSGGGGRPAAAVNMRQLKNQQKQQQQHQQLRGAKKVTPTASLTGLAAAAAAAAAAGATAQSDAWRCRNGSEISVASVSSEDMEAVSISRQSGAAAASPASASTTEAAAAGAANESVGGGSTSTVRRRGSPDSGYASPPNCCAPASTAS